MEAQQSQTKTSVAQLVEQLILTRRITCQQYHQLSSAILADGQIDEEERCLINRLFDAIQAGLVRIVN